MRLKTKAIIFMAFVIIVAGGVFLFTNYSNYIPSLTQLSPGTSGISFSMNPTSIIVMSNTTSPTVITMQVQKSASKDDAMPFAIRLVSSSPANIYPISASSNQIQYNYTTKTLALPGTSDSEQFVVHGILPKGSTTSKYNITATLYYNNTQVGSPQILAVTIQK